MELEAETDSGMLVYIIEVIEKREKASSLERSSKAKRAWDDFQEYYNTLEGSGNTLHPIADMPPNAHPFVKRNEIVFPSYDVRFIAVNDGVDKCQRK